MKRIVRVLFLILLLVLFIKVNAKEIGAFKCEYIVPFPDASKGNFFKMEIEVTDFNKSNNVTISYSEDMNSSINKKYNNKSVNLYYDARSVFVNFFSSTTTSKFIERFNTAGHCPELVSNLTSDMMSLSVENSSIPDNYTTSFSVNKEYLREPGSTTYLPSEEFWAEPTQPDPTQPDPTQPDPTQPEPTPPQNNKDMICSYDMKFESSLYYKVVFGKTFNNVKNAYSYYIQVSQTEKEWDKLLLDSLDSDVTYYIDYVTTIEVDVSSKTLKDIFNVDQCLDGSKVYYYMKNSTAHEYVITTDYDEAIENSYTGKVGDGTEQRKGEGKKPDSPELGFGNEPMSCAELLGPNLTVIVHAGIKAMQIIGAILAIVYGMMSLIPAIIAKDSDGLKKAEKKLVLMAIILLCIFLLPYLARFIGNIFDFDISCII